MTFQRRTYHVAHTLLVQTTGAVSYAADGSGLQTFTAIPALGRTAMAHALDRRLAGRWAEHWQHAAGHPSVFGRGDAPRFP